MTYWKIIVVDEKPRFISADIRFRAHNSWKIPEELRPHFNLNQTVKREHLQELGWYQSKQAAKLQLFTKILWKLVPAKTEVRRLQELFDQVEKLPT